MRLRSRIGSGILTTPALAGLLAASVLHFHRVEADESQTSIGEVPLCDLGAGGGPEGAPGGLYPGGTSIRPARHEAAGIALASREVVPRDAAGAPSPEGKIGLISVGVSHTTMMFSRDGPNSFKPRADADPSRNPRLVIVDGASDGHPTPQWLGHDPPYGGADPWSILEERLAAAQVTARQVQVVWLMSIGGEYRDRENVSFQDLTRNRQAGIEALVRALKTRFPNLTLAYTTQRPYSYSDPATGLAPEPGTYWSSFGDRGMVTGQIEGRADLEFDPGRGKAVAPWISWGPYIWADGTHPRSDGLAWLPSDFIARIGSEPDWAHPSHAGVRKEANQLLAFFKTDPTSTPWFLRKTERPPKLSAGASPASGPAPLAVKFSAEAASPSGIREVAWSFGDGCYSLLPAPAKTYHVPGAYEARVTATDQEGNSASRTVTVKVDGVASPPRREKHYPAPPAPPPSDRPPTVKITGPASGAVLDRPRRIVLSAEASDPDGEVARVDFFKGAGTSQDGAWRVWLGQAARAPYSAAWDYDPTLEYDPAGGTFILTARATDDRGAVAEDSVTIKITSGR